MDVRKTLTAEGFLEVYVEMGDAILRSMESLGGVGIMKDVLYEQVHESMVSGSSHKAYDDLGRRGQQNAFDHMLRTLESMRVVGFDSRYNLVREQKASDGRHACQLEEISLDDPDARRFIDT